MDALPESARSPTLSDADPLRPGHSLKKRLAREWLLPIGLISACYGAKLLAEPYTGKDAPFLLLLGAVSVCAYVGDLTGGLLAIALSLIASILLIEPRLELVVKDTQDLVQIYSYSGEALLITTLCVGLRRARTRAEENSEETRRLQRQVLQSVEMEQRRIGQDLHDDLGQFLTGIALSGELLARHLERQEPNCVEECRRMVHMVNESVNRVRQLARGLSPMTLDPDSLPLLLSELQERSAEISGRHVTFNIEGNPPELPHESVLHLYRIAQEGVGNALKHSASPVIQITLMATNNYLELAVSDDGPAATIARRSAPGVGVAGVGMGLRVMSFRAKSIGAELEVGAGPEGRGMTVVCKVPIGTASQPASFTAARADKTGGKP